MQKLQRSLYFYQRTHQIKQSANKRTTVGVPYVEAKQNPQKRLRQGIQTASLMETPSQPKPLEKKEENGLAVNYLDIVDIVTQWRTRLFTKLDDYRLHAVPSVIFVLYAVYEVVRIMTVLLSKQEFSAVEFSQILPVLLLVNFMKDASGARLAAKHHKGLVKFFLIQASLASVMTTAGMYYFHPSFPTTLDTTFRVASALVLPFLLYALLVYVKDGLQIANLRKEKKRVVETASSNFKGLVFYVLPLIVPLWLAINCSLLAAVGGDSIKQFLFQNFAATPEALFSLGMVSVTMGSLGPAAGTLRVRRLITAFVEQGFAVVLLASFVFVLTSMLAQSGGALGVFVNPIALLEFRQIL